MKSWPIPLLAALLLAAPTASRAQVPPEKAVSTFKVVDGLQIELFASEPLFVNPTSMDVDHRGRVWVCESVNYRHTLHRRPPNRPEGDRIVILEDSDGDGKADKATTFYQAPDFLAPLGLAVAKDPVGPGYKVFVCASPDLLVFEDKDGDGKADGPPKKLLSGFGGYDHDHGLHGVLIGPDNRLYFTVGDQGVKDLQSADGKGRKWTSNSTDCRAGTVWRCDLDGKNLELIAHNFRNNYEACVDSFGTVFLSDNDDDGNQQTRICYVMPGGDYGYNPRGPGQSHWHEERPGVVPKILRTYFGSPTGICAYEGALLPEKYRGQLLHVDAGPRHLRCYHLKPDGAGYAVDREDMVTNEKDNWFRPSDVCVAPDGSVLVADWYDPGVGGHGMGDTTRGRIFRVTPRGHKGYAPPKVDLESNDGLLAALGSPNLAVRYMAMAQLRRMPKSAAKSLLKTAGRQTDSPSLRARALWQLKTLGMLSTGPEEPWGLALADADDRFRSLAWRLREDELAELVSEKKGRLETFLVDRSPAVRRDVLLALRAGVADDSIRSLIQELAKKYDGKDRFYLEAVGIAVGHHDQKRREILLADFDKHFPGWDDKVAGLVWELRPPSVMPTLGKRLADKSLPAAQRAQIVDILAASDDQAAGKALLDVLQGDVPAEVRDKVVENLKLFLPGKWRELRQSAELTAGIERLLAKPETAPTGLTLLAAGERSDLVGKIEALVTAKDASDAVKQAAVKALGSLPTAEAVNTLRGLLMVSDPDTLGVAVVQALGQRLDDRGRNNPAQQSAAEALHSLVLGKGRPPLALRQAAVAGLAGSRAGTVWLLDLHGKGQLLEALRADAARALRNSPHLDLRNKAMAAFPPPGKLDPKKLPAIAALVLRKGDAARGKQLLAASVKSDMQCLKCHTVRGVGGQIGPDLSMVGKKAARDNLFESILYPSKAVADQYVSWVIETKKGLTLTGLLVEETADAVTLRDANGKDTKIDRKEIDSRAKSPNSLMPGDLLAYMTEDELVDVVEYLQTLKTPSFTPDAWHVAGPFNNGPGRAGLDKEFPPEKGVDLKATYQGKNGEVRWRVVKPNGQNYVDLRALHGDLSPQSVSYLYREVESPADQDATVLLGTDDGGKLWLNGKLVFRTDATRAAAPEQDAVKVRLKKGKNALLLKVDNGDGPHGAYVTVQSKEEIR